MDLDGPPANTKISCRFLARRGGYNLAQHVAFALRKPIRTGEEMGEAIAAGLRITPRVPVIDRLAHARDHCGSPEPLFQKINGAVLYCLDCRWDVTAT